MNLLALITSLMLVGQADTQPPQSNNTHGRFVVTHVPGDELKGQTLKNCEYGDGTQCLFMNRERVSHPVPLKFRIDHEYVDTANAVTEAEFIVWLQPNNNACRYTEGDPTFIARAPVHTKRVARRSASGVVFDAHRIEMNSAVITSRLPTTPVGVTQWQICVGMDPKHNATIEADKHPTGGLPFFIGTRQPEAPRLAGVKALHEKVIATLTLPADARSHIAALGLRAIPTRLATAPAQSVIDPNKVSYACPSWSSDYHNLVVGTDTKDEIKPADAKYDSGIDEDDMMHFAVDLRTIPNEPYVICAYARDKVNNLSDFSAPILGSSYRATDMFAALPKDAHFFVGHGCADIGASPLAVMAALAAVARGLRLRLRGRKTRG